jgi:uncharacterized membrane protein YukC
LKLVWPQLLGAAGDVAELDRIAGELVRPVIITREEDHLLKARGLQHSMPADWDGFDLASRYRAAAIALMDEDMALLQSAPTQQG